MTELPANNSEYVEHHPDAVQDKDLAQSMAIAGNENRTRAAIYRGVAAIYDDAGNDGSEYVREAYEQKRRKLFVSILERMQTGQLSEDEAFDMAKRIFTSSDRIDDMPYALQIEASAVNKLPHNPHYGLMTAAGEAEANAIHFDKKADIEEATAPAKHLAE